MLRWLGLALNRVRMWAWGRRPPRLDCILVIRGRQQAVRLDVVGVRGLRLLCSDPAGSDVWLVGEGQVTEAARRRFWRLWRRLSGVREARWDDGSPFRP